MSPKIFYAACLPTASAELTTRDRFADELLKQSAANEHRLLDMILNTAKVLRSAGTANSNKTHHESWYLNRREMLKGGGIALALPFLNGMSWAAPAKVLRSDVGELFFLRRLHAQRRERHSQSAKPHHEWSWWPCRDAGPLTFNQSAKLLEPLKNT